MTRPEVTLSDCEWFRGVDAVPCDDPAVASVVNMDRPYRACREHAEAMQGTKAGRRSIARTVTVTWDEGVQR